MARRRFFVDEVRKGAAEIDGEQAQHLTRVLRVEAGQRYEISDNSSVYIAEIETARKDRVVFRTVEKVELHPPPVRMILFAALIKFDHFEWIVEKSTELGVETIVPFASARTERGLERAAEKRVERWRKIALEASQQSRRDRLPEVDDPSTFESVIGRNADYRFALDEQPKTPAILSCLPKERRAEDSVAFMLGPEGGWTDDERSRFLFAGWNPVSLGPQILRAETAATAALAIVAAAWQAA
jgi:16S rRNA (uracil1498-N3)-methyltransferase